MFLATLSLTLFVSLISSSVKINKEYLFDFKPTNSLIIFPLSSFFILLITFLSTGSEHFEFLDNHYYSSVLKNLSVLKSMYFLSNQSQPMRFQFSLIVNISLID